MTIYSICDLAVIIYSDWIIRKGIEGYRLSRMPREYNDISELEWPESIEI